MELEVRLSKKAWHYKLQNYIWGYNQPKLYSLCPYFWFTIFCMLIVPFVVIVRGFMCIGNKISNYNTRKADEAFSNFMKNITPEQAVDAVIKKRKFRLYGTLERWSFLLRWRNWNPELSDDAYNKFSEKFNSLLISKEEELELKRNKPKKTPVVIEKVKRKLNVSSIVKYTKMFVGLAISLLIFWGIATLFVSAGTWNWSKFFHKALHFLAGMGILCSVGAIIAFFALGVGNSLDSMNGKEELKWHGKPFRWLGKFLWFILKWPCKIIWEIIKFIFSYFKATKDNYCPGIIWDDEKSVS